MKTLDYTLYNKVKEKFPPQPMAIIFVSLAPENLEKLEGIVFTIETNPDLQNLICGHGKDATPFATIGGFTLNEAVFAFSCREFEQEEDLIKRVITDFSLGTYNNEPVDIEAMKKEMRNFIAGALLSGNA